MNKPKCPCCNEDLDRLDYSADCVEAGTVYVSGTEDHNFDGDVYNYSGYIFSCPHCGKELTHDFDLALEFLRGKAELTTEEEGVLTPERVKAYVNNRGGQCPKCSSKNLDAHGTLQSDGGSAWQDVVCMDCGFEFKDVYTLAHVEAR